MKEAHLRRLGFALIALFVLMAVPAVGSQFVNPPEQSGYPWVTSFPYQRNIYWDFAVSPVGGPSITGTPGAEYEGLLDVYLWGSDFVTFTGDFQWYAAIEGLGTNPINGAIGIDNRNGNTALHGTAVFHLDNTLNDQYEKHMWFEITGNQSSGALGVGTIDTPAGFKPTGLSFVGSQPFGTDPVQRLENYWAGISPNPPWEELVLTLDVAAGAYWYLDSLHIATECVPEPSTMLLCLGGCGTLGVVCLRRRLRK